MIPEIRNLSPKKLIGKRLIMSFAKNTTFQLWNGFMPRRKEITNAVGTDRYSLQVYNEGFYRNFDPEATFEKWAAVDVTDFDAVPEGMDTLILPEGQYAVFNYKGTAEDAPETYKYIFMEWLPASGYVLDNRPHFEIFGDKYKHGDPESEEEIWIPVK